MAGMFDWLKSGGKGKGKARRRSGGGKRDGAARRKGAQQRRDPGNSTEFIAPQQLGSPAPGAPAPPLPPAAPPPVAHAAPPPMAPPMAPPSPPLTPPVVAPAPTPSADSGATQYHSIGPSRGGLVGILIVKDGKARDEIYKIHDGENTIGRGDSAEIKTDSRDDAVSREHAMIIHESGSFGLKPLKEGTNPTYLNDDEVSGGAALADGDTIRIGNTTLKFRVS
jgi:hypothetical protein